MTRTDFIRRRVAPVLFGVVIALTASRMCRGNDLTHATFVLTYGAAEPNVQTVDASLWMNSAEVATFHRTALGAHIGESKFTGAFPAQDGELRVDVELRSGEHRNLKRTVHADEDATVTVPLEADLR